MTDRAESVLMFFAGVALLVAFFAGIGYMMWMGMNFITDSPDLECSDLEIDDDRDLHRAVLYAHQDSSITTDRYTEGTLLIYEDGTFETTGPLEIADDQDLQFVHRDLFLFVDDSEYVVVDLSDRSIRVGPGDLDENNVWNAGRDPRETYGIYETCEVTIA